MRIVVFVCFVCVSICLPHQLCLNVIKLSLFFFGLTARVFISMQFSNAAETKLIISSRVETTGWEMCWPLRNCSDNYPTYLTHLQAVRRITISPTKCRRQFSALCLCWNVNCYFLSEFVSFYAGSTTPRTFDLVHFKCSLSSQ